VVNAVLIKPSESSKQTALHKPRTTPTDESPAKKDNQKISSEKQNSPKEQKKPIQQTSVQLNSKPV